MPDNQKSIPPDINGFILFKTDDKELHCLKLTDLRLLPSISDTIDGKWSAEGDYNRTFDIITLKNIVKSAAYISVIRKHKNLVNEIRNKQKELANLKKATEKERKRLNQLKRQ